MMDSQKTEILLAVHRAHKEELAYRRRAEYLTMVLTIIVFAGGAAAMFLLPVARHINLGGALKGIATLGIVLIADIICYGQVKNYNRMCEIQRVVASIDAALGLFTPGAFLDGQTIYPEEWKTSGKKRIGSSISRVIVISALALLCILALWARAW